MPFPPRVRLALCAAVALAAGGVAAARVAPIAPHLEIEVVHRLHDEAQDVYEVWMTPRGGEVIDEVGVEVLRGAARVVPPAGTRDLAPDARFRVRVSVFAESPVPAAVRVTQRARVDRTYDVEVVEAER